MQTISSISLILLSSVLLCSCTNPKSSTTKAPERFVTIQYRLPDAFLGHDEGTEMQLKLASTMMDGGARVNWKELLGSAGIQFPHGSSAYYNPASGHLVIRNTLENLSKADAIFWRIKEGADPVMTQNDEPFITLDQTNP